MTELADQIPYHSEPIHGAQPGHIAALALVFGFEAPDPRTSRILELACATGSNLHSIAMIFPEAQCVGIDSSVREIEIATERARTGGLTNVEFRAEKIEEFSHNAGEFDYIICHGTFSWVPDPVRQSILQLCSRHLAARGVAYLSYNTLPGWHPRQIIRDAMFLAAGEEQDLLSRAHRGRDLLSFVARSMKSKMPSLDAFLKDEIGVALNMPPWYLLHDYLAPHNKPFYVKEVLDMAKTVGLTYLADTEVSSNMPQEFDPQVQRELAQRAPQIAEREQLIDLLRNRMFRRTLLVRQEQLNKREVSIEGIRKLWLRSRLRSEGPCILDHSEVRFRQPDGGALMTAEPSMKALVQVFAEKWPVACTVTELAHEINLRLDRENHRAQRLSLEDFSRQILSLYFADLIQGLAAPTDVSQRGSGPLCVHPFVRSIVAQTAQVPSLLHESVTLSSHAQRLIPNLNGSSDRETLIKHFPLHELEPALTEIEQHGLLINSVQRKKD